MKEVERCGAVKANTRGFGDLAGKVFKLDWKGDDACCFEAEVPVAV